MTDFTEPFVYHYRAINCNCDQLSTNRSKLQWNWFYDSNHDISMVLFN